MPRDSLKLAGLLLILGLFIGAAFQTSAILLGLTLSAFFYVFRWSPRTRRPTPTGGVRLDRWLPIIAAFSAGLWRFNQYGGMNSNPIQAGADSIAHSCFAGSLVVWAFRPARGHLLMLGAGLIAVLACIIAGGSSQSDLGQNTVGLVACLGFLLASETILRPESGRTDHADTRFGMFSTLAATGILAGSSLLSQGAGVVLPDIQKSLQDRLNNSFEAITDRIRVGGARYVRGSVLGTVRNHMVGSPDEIAIRVYADSAPGYLRGSIFHQYQLRRWKINQNEARSGQRSADDSLLAKPVEPGRGFLRGPSENRLKRFVMHSVEENRQPGGTSVADRETKVIEVHNRPEKGFVIFTPLHTTWLEADAEEIRFNLDDGIVAGINCSEPYLLGVVREPWSQRLTEARRESLLTVPRSVAEITKSLADELCVPGLSPRKNAEAVANYFQSRFQYSLDPVPRRRGQDPIDTFLRRRHPAHCEYFATATALILRQADIPTRYVTGYVTTELSTEEDYYMARNRDAHAWVEAYDDRTSQWFSVESTPGRRYRTVTFEETEIAQTVITDDFNDGSGTGNQGWLTRINAFLARYGVQTFVSMIFQSVQLPLFMALVGLLWYRTRARAGQGQDADEREAMRRLKKMDRQMKRLDLVRPSTETLHRFAARIDDVCRSDPAMTRRPVESATLSTAADWYRNFAVDRYRGGQSNGAATKS